MEQSPAKTKRMNIRKTFHYSILPAVIVAMIILMIAALLADADNMEKGTFMRCPDEMNCHKYECLANNSWISLDKLKYQNLQNKCIIEELKQSFLSHPADS